MSAKKKTKTRKIPIGFNDFEWHEIQRAATLERLAPSTFVRVVALEVSERANRDGKRPFILDRVEFKAAIDAGAEAAVTAVLERAIRRAVKQSAAETLELVARAGVLKAAEVVRTLSDGG